MGCDIVTIFLYHFYPGRVNSGRQVDHSTNLKPWDAWTSVFGKNELQRKPVMARPKRSGVPRKVLQLWLSKYKRHGWTYPCGMNQPIQLSNLPTHQATNKPIQTISRLSQAIALTVLLFQTRQTGCQDWAQPLQTWLFTQSGLQAQNPQVSKWACIRHKRWVPKNMIRTIRAYPWRQ